MKNSEEGFSLIHALLIILVIGAIVGVGLFVKSKSNKSETTNNVTTIEQSDNEVPDDTTYVLLPDNQVVASQEDKPETEAASITIKPDDYFTIELPGSWKYDTFKLTQATHTEYYEFIYKDALSRKLTIIVQPVYNYDIREFDTYIKWVPSSNRMSVVLPETIGEDGDHFDLYANCGVNAISVIGCGSTTKEQWTIWAQKIFDDDRLSDGNVYRFHYEDPNGESQKDYQEIKGIVESLKVN